MKSKSTFNIPKNTQVLGLSIFVMTMVFGRSLILYAQEARIWTSVDGRTLEAEFVAATEREVTIRRKNDGRRFTLPLDKISENDRHWIKAEA